jgi:hypothetical protein
MVAELTAEADKLPPGPTSQLLFREIAQFRARITDLKTRAGKFEDDRKM